jgi:hypothetical protein
MYKSHGIIGPFNARLAINGAPKKPVAVRLIFGADDRGMTIVLNKHTQAIMEKILAKAERELRARSVAEAEGHLFERVNAAIPAMRDQFNKHAFALTRVSVAPEQTRATDHYLQIVDPADAISQHQATFWHTHNRKVGPDSTYHSHKVAVRFFIAAAGEASSTGNLPEELRAGLKSVVRKFFAQKNDFSGTTLEEAGARLFDRTCQSIPALVRRSKAQPHLHAVSLAIQYDGSLDHPTQRMEFIRSL